MDSDTSEETAVFEEFEEKFMQLLQLCEQLKVENNALKAKQAALLASHDDLAGKNELARAKVSSILTRLKQAEMEA